MKIALIQPKTPGTEGWCPPLGLAYLASAAEQEGHDIQIFDLNAKNISDESLLKDLKDRDIIGITSTMASHEEAIRLAHLCDGWPIVFGGPQASARPEPYLTIPEAVVFKGEAEVSFPSYLRALEQGYSALETPGIIFRNEVGEIEQNSLPPLIKTLDTSPLPSRHLLDMNAYTVRLLDRPATNMMSSRGCPFECIFCYHDFLGRVYRPRSPENIVREIEFLEKEYGIGAILFYDDNFTLNSQRVHAICDLLIERRLDIAWRCFSRVDVVNSNLLQKMKTAGCCEIVFGVESGNQHTLDQAGKGIKVEDSLNAIRLCQEVGIVPKSFIMFGFPWETKEDIEETLNFIDQLLPGQVHPAIVIPFPGTPLEQMLLKQGIQIDEKADIVGSFVAQPLFETEHFTKQELVEFRDMAYEKIRKANISHSISYEWQCKPDWNEPFNSRK